jgi:hypothetical protein
MDRKPGNSSAKETSMNYAEPQYEGSLQAKMAAQMRPQVAGNIARAPIMPLAQAVQDNLNAAHRIRCSAQDVRIRLFGNNAPSQRGDGGVEVPVQPSISENVLETLAVLDEIESILSDILNR